jgi:hypothetical protein
MYACIGSMTYLLIVHYCILMIKVAKIQKIFFKYVICVDFRIIPLIVLTFSELSSVTNESVRLMTNEPLALIMNGSIIKISVVI